MKKYLVLILLVFIAFSFSSCDFENKNYIFFNTNSEEIINEIEISENVNLPEPKKERYNFLGWYLDEDFKIKIDNSYFNDEIKTNVVLYARWEINNDYNVEDNFIKAYYIIGNGFESIIEKVVDNKVEDKSLSKEGYNFLGWYSDPGLNQRFDFDVNVDDNVFLYAKWEQKSYVVNFYDANNEIFKTQIVNYKESANIESYPLKKGYYFKNWDKSYENVTQNLDIYPIYEVASLKITVFDNLTNKIKTIYVDYGSILDKSKIYVEKENYTFINFYSDNTYTNLFDFSKEITDAISIFALYEIDKFKVTFYTEDNDIFNEQIVDYNTSATINSYPVKTGYDFIQWDKDFTNVKSDLNIYPIYNKHKYNINFIANIPECDFNLLIEYNELIKNPSFINKEAYNFIGFYSESEFINEFDFSKPITKDLNIYLKYEIKKFTVKFVIIDESNPYNEQIVEYGKSAVYPGEPTKEEFPDIIFLGWIEDFTNVKSDLIIHANYESAYAFISFETNGGTNIDTIKLLKGSKLTSIPIITKKWYSFDGLYKDNNLKNLFDINEVINSDIILYAKWTPITYSIEYNLNGGNFNDTYPTTFTVLENIILTSPKKDYVDFLGFYLTSDFDENTKIEIINESFLENINFNNDKLVLYAKWSDIEIFYYNNFVYKVDNKEVIILDYLDDEISTLYVPNIINGKAVKYLESNALDNATLANIYLPVNLISAKSDTFNSNSNLYFTGDNYTDIPLNSFENTIYIPYELISDNYLSDFNNLIYYINYFGEIETSTISSKEDFINFINYALLNKFNDFNLTINFTQNIAEIEEIITSNLQTILFSTNIYAYSVTKKNNNIFNIKFYYNETELASVSASDKNYFTQLNAFNINNQNNYVGNFPIDSVNKLYYVDNSEELFLAVMNGYNPQILNDKTLNIYNSARSILREIISNDMNDFEKVYSIYNYLILNVTYDYDIYELLETDNDMKKYKAFYLEGVFEDYRAVCDGLSKAFVLMCSIEGIQSIKVVGNDITEPNSNVGHAWNKVCIDDTWYVVDTTSGNAIYQDKKLEILTNGFLFISDSEYLQNYIERGEYPLATGTYNIYEKLIFEFEETEYDLIIDTQEELNILICYFFNSNYDSIDCKIDFNIGEYISDEFTIAFQVAKNNNFVDDEVKETYTFNIVNDIYTFIKVYQ